MGGYQHTPVMVREVTELLAPVPTGTVVDATVGGGGHARSLLEARPDLRLLGIDRDPSALAAARAELRPFGDRAQIVHGGFEHIAEIVRHEREGNIMGILFDLGVSSPQLDLKERGFTYWGDAPLDMRMDSAQALTAEQVVNEYDLNALAALLAGNGDERFARSIAARIIANRPLHTTGDLVRAVREGIPARNRRRGGHPARRTFQAIRMEVNRELPNLADGLDDAVHLVGPDGRIVVLSYHSLEDRLVKERFSAWAGADTEVPHGLPVEPPAPRALVRRLTRRPARPSAAEVAANPRAESARLRAVERLGTP